MLFLLARQRRFSKSFLPACGKITLSSAVMGAAIMFLQFVLERFVTLPAAVGLMFIVGAAATIYAVIAYVVGAVPTGLLRQSHD